MKPNTNDELEKRLYLARDNFFTTTILMKYDYNIVETAYQIYKKASDDLYNPKLKELNDRKKGLRK